MKNLYAAAAKECRLAGWVCMAGALMSFFAAVSCFYLVVEELRPLSAGSPTELTRDVARIALLASGSFFLLGFLWAIAWGSQCFRKAEVANKKLRELEESEKFHNGMR